MQDKRTLHSEGNSSNNQNFIFFKTAQIIIELLKSTKRPINFPLNDVMEQ